MESNAVVQIVESRSVSSAGASDRIVFDLPLRTCDGVDTVSVAVADRPARLSDLVPTARTLADLAAAAAREHLGSTQTPVACRAGCDACCRYLVSLSVPEAFRIREEVFALPAEKRRMVLDGFITASQTVLNARGPVTSRPAESAEAPLERTDLLQELSDWYAALSLDCPMLDGSSCGMYDRRPLVCREHLVTHAPSQCADRDATDTGHAVTLSMSLAEVLAQWSAELEGTDPQAVILPLTLLWTQDNRRRGEQTWPAIHLVERLAAVLATAVERSAPEVRSGEKSEATEAA